MDYHSCPGSGGISDASTLPMHPPPGMGYATPMPSTPFAYACPAMGTTSSSQQIGAPQGRITSDEVRKDRSPLPKLVIKGGDATTLTRVINEWIQKNDNQFEHLVTIRCYFLGSGCWNGTSETQLVDIAFAGSAGNAHRTTNNRSDNTTPTTHARGHDESGIAEQRTPGKGPNHIYAKRCHNSLRPAFYHLPDLLAVGAEC